MLKVHNNFMAELLPCIGFATYDMTGLLHV